MDIFDQVIAAVLGTTIAGFFGWVFSINNRVTIIETDYKNLMILSRERFDSLDEKLDIKFDSIERRLSQIEKNQKQG